MKHNTNQHTPSLHSADSLAFLQEATDLFTKKRQGHLIHRMYMTEAALAYWSEFMKHDGYYITRSEISLIRQCSAAIGKHAQHPQGIIGIENGPGTQSAILNKSSVFFSAMPGLHSYVGRDWSPSIMNTLEQTLSPKLPHVKIIPDMSNYLKDPLPQDLGEGRKVIAEFGITRGNMEGFAHDPFPAQILAADMAFQRSQLNKGDLYILTFDANQNKSSIEYAYTSEWLTQWGRELFRAMVRDLPIAGNFDPEAFNFVPHFHARNHINTNNMVATRNMHFTIGQQAISINRGDAFAITNSYKTPLNLFGTLAHQAGFDIIAIYQDSQHHMTMPVLKAV